MPLSVSQLYVAESLSLNYELKTMWNEVDVPYLRNYPGIWEGTKETQIETQGSRCPG